MPEKKRWATLVRPGTWFHLARLTFTPESTSRLHTHDFPEIFWIESGTAGHAINGAAEKLSSGDLVFVRAADLHHLHPVDTAGFVLVNLAFPARLLADLSARHPEIADLHAAKPAFPIRRRLSSVQTGQLREDVRRLAGTEARRLPGERFLLGLYLMASASPDEMAPALPDWLQAACAALERPEHFSAGVPAFVRLCGRSPEYVARTCRSLLGRSPTELVNAVRLAYAARELRLGTRPILEITLACGFNNLAHFYKLFAAAHGTTPRRYRISHQRAVV